MAFSIEITAKDYVSRRFPEASTLEKRKIIRDWQNKIKDSKLLVEDFKRRVGNPKGKTILDAGCGNGGVSIAFSIEGADVYGVEVEKDLFEIAKRHAEAWNVNPNFFLYDGSRLPFDDNFFDYAVSVSVLEHTDDPVFYLKEVLRVLKPGGKAYLGFPNKWAPRETHTQLLFLTYLPSFLQSFYVKICHRNPLSENNLHFYSYFDLLKMLKQIKKDRNKQSVFSIMEEEGASPNKLKKAIKLALKIIGLPYKALLPHILVVLKKDEK